MNLQSGIAGRCLERIFDKVEECTNQGVAIAQQSAGVGVALPANSNAFQLGLGRYTKCCKQFGGCQPVLKRQITAGENQHVTNLMFQLVQPVLQTTGKPLLVLGRRRSLVGEKLATRWIGLLALVAVLLFYLLAGGLEVHKRLSGA